MAARKPVGRKPVSAFKRAKRNYERTEGSKSKRRDLMPYMMSAFERHGMSGEERQAMARRYVNKIAKRPGVAAREAALPPEALLQHSISRVLEKTPQAERDAAMREMADILAKEDKEGRLHLERPKALFQMNSEIQKRYPRFFEK
jgi:hypothetical protein